LCSLQSTADSLCNYLFGYNLSLPLGKWILWL
jgi:hypothetical protein